MNRLRKFFTQNPALKLLSLVLAVIVWSAVSGDIPTEIVLAVPVEFRNVPPDVELAAEPTSVELRVRGLRRIVRGAAATDFSVPVDLSALAGTGEKTYSLRPEDVEAPASLEVVQITPAQVKFTVKGVREEGNTAAEGNDPAPQSFPTAR